MAHTKLSIHKHTFSNLKWKIQKLHRAKREWKRGGTWMKLRSTSRAAAPPTREWMSCLRKKWLELCFYIISIAISLFSIRKEKERGWISPSMGKFEYVSDVCLSGHVGERRAECVWVRYFLSPWHARHILTRYRCERFVAAVFHMRHNKISWKNKT